MQVTSFTAAVPSSSPGASLAVAGMGGVAETDAAAAQPGAPVGDGTEDAQKGDAGLAFAEALAASLVAPLAAVPAQVATVAADQAAATAGRPQPLNATPAQSFDVALAAAAPAKAGPLTAANADLPASLPTAPDAPSSTQTASLAPGQADPTPTLAGPTQPGSPAASAPDLYKAPLPGSPKTAETPAPAVKPQSETPAPAVAVATAPAAAPPVQAAVVAPPVAAASVAASAAASAEVAAKAPEPPAADRPSGRAEVRATRADGRGKGSSTPAAAGAAQPGFADHLAAKTGQATAATSAVAARSAQSESDAQVEPTAKPAAVTHDADAATNTQAAAPQTVAQSQAQGTRVTAATVPHLAAQIVQKLDAKVTRFDIALNPAGLGKVDVKVEINAAGAISAALSFDNPQAADALRGRADELKTALQQAGFDLSDAGLSFNHSGGQQRSAEERQVMADAFAGRAFAAAADQAETLQAAVADAAARLQRRGASGVDIRI